MQRFGVDQAQADRVSHTAQSLFAPMLHAESSSNTGRPLKKLHWAAQLHEIGMRISHSDYHKHGAYILDNTDLPGFTIGELHRLSQLVLGHRGKLRKLESELKDPLFAQQLMAIRLSVILCHARRDPQITNLQIHCDAASQSAQLHFTSEWAEQWPQSAHLLREEAVSWQKAGWQLQMILD